MKQPNPDATAKITEIRYTLTEPIEAHGQPVTELVIPLPLRCAHLEAIDDVTGNNKRLMKLIEVVCKIPPSSIRQITWPDLGAISQELEPFLLPAQKTTGTS